VIRRLQLISDGPPLRFSTDPNLDFQTLLDYYSLRFQIEFDFRDAKQHFGLSDFKNYKQENLTNFVNLSFTMCLLAKVQLAYYRKMLYAPKLSIIDLKLIYKARFTAKNIVKLVRKDHDTIFNEQFCEQFLPQDLINAA
jgi:putative transposase